MAIALPCLSLYLAATGCGGKPAAITQCEALLLPKLKAPSTYKLADSTIGLPDKDGTRDVFLHYDAANSYNAPIRDIFWCKIDKQGEASEASNIPDSMIDPTANLTGDDSGKNDDLAVPVTPAPTPSYDAMDNDYDDMPVCDREDSPETRALMNEIGTNCNVE